MIIVSYHPDKESPSLQLPSTCNKMNVKAFKIIPPVSFVLFSANNLSKGRVMSSESFRLHLSHTWLISRKKQQRRQQKQQQQQTQQQWEDDEIHN